MLAASLLCVLLPMADAPEVRPEVDAAVKKAAAQTAQEFVRVIEDERLRARVGRFTDAYESARFGNSSHDALRLPELYEEVESVAKK